MGIFNYGYLLEVEVPDGDEEEQYSLSDNEEAEQGDDTPEETPDDEDEGTGQDDDASEEEDYTLDGDDEESEDEPGEDEEESDDMSPTDDYSDAGDDESLDGEIKQSENELMDELSEQEKYIRDKDLKRTYVELYNSISNILMKVDRVVKTADNIKTLNYCEKRLINTQEMLYDYLLDAYRHKSYIQNLTMYYHIIGVLTGIEQLFNSLTNSTKV